MLAYEDACGEANLYAVWLVRTYEPRELARQVGKILQAGGYVVAEEFVNALGTFHPIDLADFKAANFPFDVDDGRWLDHCHRAYPTTDSAAMTPGDRNGARVSWRGVE